MRFYRGVSCLIAGELKVGQKVFMWKDDGVDTGMYGTVTKADPVYADYPAGGFSQYGEVLTDQGPKMVVITDHGDSRGLHVTEVRKSK